MDTQERVKEHLKEAKTLVPYNNIVGIFLQGSQNYHLNYVGSDVDTKCITTPVLHNLCLNRKPLSTTHVRANDEHIDLKDIRLYIDTFKKQNLNFLEILWTDYKILNPLYEESWNKLVQNRESIARMNPLRAVKSMYGIAMEKYHALEHPYPSKLHLIETIGFDPKQLHHLFRVEEYLERYIAGESYENCLISNQADFLRQVKDVEQCPYNLESARVAAKESMNHIQNMMDNFKERHPKEVVDENMVKLLEGVCCEVIETSLKNELKYE